ncbi:S-layer homology domain-containing protein [Clostridiaceae bacterium M8S5]|nr:S-layer homology domain-containing protein [Clostridiaceae bacterium M8S5]
MVKSSKLVIIVLITVLAINTVYAQVGQAIDGITSYDSLKKNISFSDVKGHWAEKYINTMSALSIIKGAGSSRFNPSGKLTYEQSLILLVRLLGLEEEAQKRGQDMNNNTDTAGYNILSAHDYYVKGYVDVAKNKGIITQEEINAITKTNQSTSDKIEDEIDTQMARYDANLQITQIQLANIRAKLKEKITRKYTYQKSVTREQVAVFAARAIGLKPIVGSKRQKIYTLKDYSRITPSYLPLIEAVLQNGIISGNNANQFRPKDSINRAEMTKILYKIARPIMVKNGYQINTATIQNIEEAISKQTDGLTGRTYTAKVKVFTVADDVSIKNIHVQEAGSSNTSKGFIVIDGNRLSSMDRLKIGDTVRYYIDNDNRAVLVERLANSVQNLTGFIEKVEGGYISFKDFNDVMYKYELAKGANIIVNGDSILAKDLLYGQEVSVEVTNNKISRISSNLEIGEEGYIEKGDKIITGKVLSKDKYSGQVTLATPNEVKNFIIDGYANIIKDGNNVDFQKIQDGDLLRLEFDDYNTNRPSKVTISSADIQISALYKVELQDVDTMRKQLILGDIKRYNHGSWMNEEGKKDLQINQACKIYVGNVSLSLEELKNYKGKEAYIAVQENFGQDEAIKLIVKNNYETKYDNSIQKIEYGSNTLRVEYRNIGFDNDSTIIVKNNRLIHPYNLSKGDDILVYSYGVNNPHAAFISVLEEDANGLVVYRGRIDEINKYNIDLDKIYYLEDNKWQKEKKQTTFNISNDTKIIDTRKAQAVDVTVDAFLNSRHLKSSDPNNYYKKYAYAVEYNGMVLAMNIIDNSTKSQVVTIATVDDIDKANITLELKDVKDYSFFTNKWNLNNASLYLMAQKAIFIKDGKIVGFDHVKKGDKLYILRKNGRGDIVLIK